METPAEMGAHPHMPAGLDIPGYVPQRLSSIQAVGAYLGPTLLVILAVWLLSGRSPRLSRADRLQMCWWALNSLNHLVIEGAFIFTPDFFSTSNPSYLDEIWKEYSKGDSRYLAGDTTIVAMEWMMLLLEGPACVLAIYAVASRKSYSHTLQFSLCLGHLFAMWFYCGTAYLNGFNFWASPYYFWTYFVGVNAPWAVIPFIIATRSWMNISIAVHQSQKVKTT